jgi:hypothetical protein
MTFSRTASWNIPFVCAIGCTGSTLVEPVEPHASFTVVTTGVSTTYHASSGTVSCRATPDLAGAPALYAHFTSLHEAPEASLSLAADPYPDNTQVYDAATYGTVEPGVCGSGPCWRAWWRPHSDVEHFSAPDGPDCFLELARDREAIHGIFHCGALLPGDVAIVDGVFACIVTHD